MLHTLKTRDLEAIHGHVKAPSATCMHACYGDVVTQYMYNWYNYGIHAWQWEVDKN